MILYRSLLYIATAMYDISEIKITDTNADIDIELLLIMFLTA